VAQTCACAEDTELRSEVEALLAFHESQGAGLEVPRVAQTCAVGMSADRIASWEAVPRQDAAILQMIIIQLNPSQPMGLPASFLLTGFLCLWSGFSSRWRSRQTLQVYNRRCQTRKVTSS